MNCTPVHTRCRSDNRHNVRHWSTTQLLVAVVVRRAYTRRHNYRVTSAPPSRLSLRKQKCLQWSTEFAKLIVWPSQFRRQAVPDPGASSGETLVAKTGTGLRVLGTMHVSTSAERRRRWYLSEETKMQLTNNMIYLIYSNYSIKPRSAGTRFIYKINHLLWPIVLLISPYTMNTI